MLRPISRPTLARAMCRTRDGCLVHNNADGGRGEFLGGSAADPLLRGCRPICWFSSLPARRFRGRDPRGGGGAPLWSSPVNKVCWREDASFVGKTRHQSSSPENSEKSADIVPQTSQSFLPQYTVLYSSILVASSRSWLLQCPLSFYLMNRCNCYSYPASCYPNLPAPNRCQCTGILFCPTQTICDCLSSPT